MLVGAGVAHRSLSPHPVFIVRRGANNAVETTADPVGTTIKYYTVEIPAEVYPGEIFRASVEGKEVLVTCPEVSGPGERIVIGVESEEPPMATVVTATATATATPVVVVSATVPETAHVVTNKI